MAPLTSPLWPGAIVAGSRSTHKAGRSRPSRLRLGGALVTRAPAGLLIAFGLVAAACGSSEVGVAQEELSAESTGSAASATRPLSSGAPVLAPGEITSGSVDIDGVSIDYVVSTPEGFRSGDEAPLLLAFAPGGQGLDVARSVLDETYAPEAQRLGWVVITPAAPNGELYFQGSELLVPGFLDWVETWMNPEGGAPHVAGPSNGGISSFRYAALNPHRVLSLTIFPGLPRSEDDTAALPQLVNVPIRFYVGGDDTGWIGPAQEAANTLVALGADIDLTIFEGEGHVIASTRDGSLIFEQLENFR